MINFIYNVNINMHRNKKGEVYSNGRIRYNMFAKTKSNNYYIVDEYNGLINKVMVDKIYNYSVSNKKQKEMNNKKVIISDYL